MNLRWLSSLMSEARQHPAFSEGLEFVSAEATQVREELIDGSLHAGFFAGCQSHPELVCERLFRERFTVAAGRTHPFANVLSPRFEQLRGAPVVWLRRDLDPVLYDSFLNLCSAQEYAPQVVQEVGTFYECLEFAREGGRDSRLF